MNSSEKLEVQINLFILRAEIICFILYYQIYEKYYTHIINIVISYSGEITD